MKKVNDNFLVGSDPEVFIKHKITGDLISSIGIIGGTKEKPLPMMQDGFFCQEDNVLAEFNIPPAKSEEEFVSFISAGLAMLDNRLPDDMRIDVSPYGFFKPKQLKSKAAKEFGCDPDINCWTMLENEKPEAENKLLRTAGGHISVGYNNPSTKTSLELAKWLDTFIGVPSVHLSDEAPRRALYGKMGAMRFKDFGMEYRTVSNFWLKTKERIKWVYNQVEIVVDIVNSGKSLNYEDQAAITAAINMDNKKAADWLIKKYKINMV